MAYTTDQLRKIKQSELRRKKKIKDDQEAELKKNNKEEQIKLF